MCIQPSAAHRAKNCRWTSRCSASADATEPAAADVRDARRRGILRFGLSVGAPPRRSVPAPRSTAPGIAVLMLHALNPYGFSHLRRVNEDNVDLNRNFVDFAAPLPVNPAYAEIHSLLLPATWPPSTESEARLGAWVAQHGRQAYQAAVSSGQYAFPDGMFYGGSKPTWSNLTLRSVLREHAARRGRLGWIDFHTGLGPRGHGEKIYAGLENAARHRPHQGVVGKRRDVVLRWIVDLRSRRRHHRRRCLRRVSGYRILRHRARIRHAAHRADAAGASRRALVRTTIPKRPPTSATRSSARSATSSTSMPTTGRRWSTRRRSPQGCRLSSIWHAAVHA